MPKVESLRSVLRALEKLERESRRKHNGNVIVGYTASYAIYVHENLEAKHGAKYNREHAGQSRTKKTGRFMKGKGTRGPNQQAKFLEKPARELQNAMAAIVVKSVKAGVALTKALLQAGLLLQRESQKIVPVETGNLKGSAFTEKE